MRPILSSMLDNFSLLFEQLSKGSFLGTFILIKADYMTELYSPLPTGRQALTGVLTGEIDKKIRH